MKKSLIAASASAVALAAMPAVGVFAVGNNGSIIDTISTTVAPTCTFTRQATKHGNDGTWTPGGASSDSTDVMTAATITIGSEQTLGTSNFNVVCNDHNGYAVTVAADGLALPTGQTQLHNWNYVASAPESPTASYWRIDSTGENVNLASNVVSTKSSAQDSKDFTITYKAYAIATQDSGTYSANATYTFAQLPEPTNP